MGMASLTSILIVIVIAIGVTAWLLITRRGEPHIQQIGDERRGEPGQPQHGTEVISLLRPEESRGTIARDEPLEEKDEISTEAATERESVLEGDGGLVTKEDFTTQIQEKIPIASEALRDPSSEAKRVEVQTHTHSEAMQLVTEQQSEELARKPVTGKVETTPSLGEMEKDGESIESAVIEPLKKAPRVAPEKRGGRSRVSVPAADSEGEQGGRRRKPKPEIVCWKKDREWILGVELPEDLSENSGMTIVQNGKTLLEDESEKGCWQIEQLNGEIVVHGCEAEEESFCKVILGDSSYLVFKLSGGDLNQGRRVRQPSLGSYLVIVPADWERDKELSGPAPAAPESVCLDGYCAHFFTLESGLSLRMAFRDEAESSVIIGAKESRFQVVGQRFDDASESIGPLFGGTPPQIGAVTESVWTDVGTIVVGAEGRGKERWRVAFNPKPGVSQQELPSEMVARRAGWFFLRLYDLHDELIESLDFRFVAGLKRFSLCQPSPFPSTAGHAETDVELLHDADCHVTPFCPSARHAKIKQTSDKTVLTIPALPSCESSRWLLGPLGGPRVEMTILVERVWWATSEERQPPSQWQDTCIRLKREDFTATSEKAVWLRFPKRRWTDSILAGFKREKWRTYSVKVNETLISIPLRDFADSDEVADRAQRHFLKVWIMRENSVQEGVIANLSADAPSEFSVGDFTIENISPSHLASALTSLRKVTSGSLRLLIKEVRREYRRPRCSGATHNGDFVKRALCVVAVILREAEDREVTVPRLRKHWIARARFAANEFPETMRQVWRRYRELQ